MPLASERSKASRLGNEITVRSTRLISHPPAVQSESGFAEVWMITMPVQLEVPDLSILPDKEYASSCDYH